jgi:hypothetical protein
MERQTTKNVVLFFCFLFHFHFHSEIIMELHTTKNKSCETVQKDLKTLQDCSQATENDDNFEHVHVQ